MNFFIIVSRANQVSKSHQNDRKIVLYEYYDIHGGHYGACFHTVHLTNPAVLRTQNGKLGFVLLFKNELRFVFLESSDLS